MPPTAPGATTLVLNWHWSCADSRPAPLDVVGATVCASCNIAISLRIASPGDTGAITQTIAAGTLAVAPVGSGVQQDASVPAPPGALVAPPAAPAADAAVSAGAPASVVQFPFDDGPSGPIVSLPDDAPRHGGDALSASWRAGQTHVRAVSVVVTLPAVWQEGSKSTLTANALEIVAATVVRERADRPRPSAGATPAHGAHLPFPPPGPGDETPSTVVALSPVGLQHPAGSSLIALAIGALGLILFLFCSYLVPLTRLARTRPSGAEPHPPG